MVNQPGVGEGATGGVSQTNKDSINKNIPATSNLKQTEIRQVESKFSNNGILGLTQLAAMEQEFKDGKHDGLGLDTVEQKRVYVNSLLLRLGDNLKKIMAHDEIGTSSLEKGGDYFLMEGMIKGLEISEGHEGYVLSKYYGDLFESTEGEQAVSVPIAELISGVCGTTVAKTKEFNEGDYLNKIKFDEIDRQFQLQKDNGLLHLGTKELVQSRLRELNSANQKAVPKSI